VNQMCQGRWGQPNVDDHGWGGGGQLSDGRPQAYFFVVSEYVLESVRTDTPSHVQGRPDCNICFGRFYSRSLWMTPRGHS